MPDWLNVFLFKARRFVDLETLNSLACFKQPDASLNYREDQRSGRQRSLRFTAACQQEIVYKEPPNTPS
jgi:hypothetical protein